MLLCGRAAFAADAILSWSSNTESDLAGYRVHYGSTSGSYPNVIDVGLVTSYTVTGLSAGTYYFVLTAYNTAGIESGFSNEVSKVIADTAPPVLSSVAAGSIASTAATISWTTSEPATSLVQYGISTAYGLQTTENPVVSGSHQHRLTGLQASTTYHFRVLSRDAAGNLATSSDRTFVTLAPADTTAPTISAVSAASLTTSGATIAWTTNEPATTQVQYGVTTAYGSTTGLNSTLLTAHSQALTGLAAGTDYHFRVLSRDAAGNTSASADQTFRTAAANTRITFTYPTRLALLADGWSYVAKTAGGNARNTEQTGSLAVNYDQSSHPGTIRIPLGQGELWQALNNSQNTLFRNLPSTWTSIRLKIAAFGPAADFQQVGLLAYQDDDNYVNVQRNYNSGAGGPVMGFSQEVGGATNRTDRRPLANTGNLILRLDRNPATDAYTAFYSTNDGGTWVQLTGAPTVALSNPKLAIQVGANTAGTLPNADLAWVEIFQSSATAPSPTSGPVHLDFTYAGRTALFSAGWDYLARTVGGGTRNTEQSGSLAADYDQSTHPGTIRIPLGPGELWQGANNSQNMLSRDLPSDWTSIRLKIAAFGPAADFQQVGLIAYQDDDNYVNVQRNYGSGVGGPVVGFFREAAGVPIRTDRRPLANTGNLILRLDRDPATNAYTAFYSTNDGGTWVQLTGTPTQTLTNPRLAIQVGANIAGTLPTVDLAWVEIRR